MASPEAMSYRTLGIALAPTLLDQPIEESDLVNGNTRLVAPRCPMEPSVAAPRTATSETYSVHMIPAARRLEQLLELWPEAVVQLSAMDDYGPFRQEPWLSATTTLDPEEDLGVVRVLQDKGGDVPCSRCVHQTWRGVSPISTSDQSCGNLAQQRTAVLDDGEMGAVHTNYTACIADQDLPPSAQDVYRLVASTAVDAMLKSNEHSGLSTQKANVVHCMDRYIRETTLDLNTARQDLSKRTDDNRLFRFPAHLGDYAGALCDTLKEHGNKQFLSVLSKPWTMIVRAIDKFDKELAGGENSGQHGTYPDSVHLDTIKRGVQRLFDLDFTNLDIATALFAIRSYARRNFCLPCSV